MPLALFGFLHGAHEWLEILLLQYRWFNLPLSPSADLLRVCLLAVSFVPLLLYGYITLLAGRSRRPVKILIFCAYLVLFGLLVLINYRRFPQNILERVDVLARYFLAVPGAALASLELWLRFNHIRSEGKSRLVGPLLLASASFLVYALSQLFAPPVAMFPASILNTGLFSSALGFPIQLLRAAAAFLITLGLIRSLQLIAEERQAQLNFAQQARLEALESVRQELEQRELLRREYLRRTAIAQEEERTRIARELHDETAQLLTAQSLNLATIKNSPGAAQQERLINQLIDLNRRMAGSIYRLIQGLRPAQLDDLGLVPALRSMVDDYRASQALDVELTITGLRVRLDPLAETVLYRVAQEALTNVVRHAGVSRASIHLIFEPEAARLVVSDRGCGFDPHNSWSPPQGLGLAGMRERVESVEGTFTIQSEIQKGTTLEAAVPLIVPVGNLMTREVAYGPAHSRDAGR
jgi:signal transduction histidine kinase